MALQQQRREDEDRNKTVLVVGATGYIGGAVVAEAVRQGYRVLAVVRALKEDTRFDGAEVVVADVGDPASMAKACAPQIDVVISCLATRSGLPRDFDDIDYKATLNVLNVALAHGAAKFILLSAICVRKPDLPLQLAKLKMEDALMRSGIDYTIVRPTAYFWVFDSQARMIAKGRPAYLIGSGDQAVHNPISREDLAEFMVGSITDAERRNRVFVIGGPEGPGNIVSYRDALGMVFEALGKEPRFIRIPDWAMRALIRVTAFIGLASRRAAVFSGFLKVVYYYMVNDMRAPGYGTRTFREHVLETTRGLKA
ncbi:MAG: NAD(P)H-binding protein [Gammaproteobacteria bacterium]|nr:NAD(P)H-binding protein [Gammaproteobacteria bacterium]